MGQTKNVGPCRLMGLACLLLTGCKGVVPSAPANLPAPSVTILPMTSTPFPTETLLATTSTVEYQNPVMGVVLSYPAADRVVEDQRLFSSYGFWVVDAERNDLFGMDWLYQASPQQIDAIVQQAIKGPNAGGLNIQPTAIEIRGHPATALYGMPGIHLNTQIYIAINGRLYHLLYEQDHLDELGWRLLNSISFNPPTKSLESLNLPTAEP